MKADFAEDLEPLFDYSHVQPVDFICLDDDCSDASPLSIPMKKRTSKLTVEKIDDDVEVINIMNCKDKDEDWLPAPPKDLGDFKVVLDEDSTIKELRLKKQELELVAKSAEDVFRAAEETVKKECSRSGQVVEKAGTESSPHLCGRAKIVISIQSRVGLQKFRVYKDEKFERLFKMYANKHGNQNLIFTFDGDKVSPTATPDGLGMEDDEIIEVS